MIDGATLLGEWEGPIPNDSCEADEDVVASLLG